MVEKKKYVRFNKVTGGQYDAYGFYRNKYPSSKIKLLEYAKICQQFNKMISDKIIKESFEFKMFNKLGSIRIRSKKIEIKIKDGRIDTNRMPIDWKSTKEMWDSLYGGHTKEFLPAGRKKIVIHTNENANGYMMKFHWYKTAYPIANQSVYKFHPVKGGISKDGYMYGRRGLAAWMKSDERTNEYYL